MPPGRPRKPTILKLVKGTLQKCRTNPDEPEPDILIPEPPHHLSKYARIEWNRMAPILADMGLMSDADLVAFSLYCQHWGRHVKAEYMIRKHGEIETTSNGNIIQSPWIGISNTSATLAHKVLSCFGMTPADRSRVSAKNEESKKNPKERFFK